MVQGIDDTLLYWTSLGALFLALAISFVVVTRFSERSTLIAPVRERLVLGIPWGTTIVVVLVYVFYHLVQGGGEPGGPIITGFRSWSIWYPQSMLFSSFAHASKGHLISNLLGTVAFAPIAEYAWSHYPTDRGTQSFSSWRTNPFVRITLFVVAVFLLGLLGSLLVPGAVIGFSGVVFAFAGFAIVTRPLASVLAILAIRVVSLVRRAFLDPFSVAVAEPRFISPSWANTALQGHVFGLFVGVLLAAVLVHMRDESPNLRYVWFAALVFALSRSMHAIYWYLTADSFVFFRGIGTAAVLLLASIVTLTVLKPDQPLVDRIDLSVRTTALMLLLAVVCALALVGIPYNLVSVTPGEEAENGIEINDYTVTYAQGVNDRYVAALQAPVVRESLSVNVSGVIVVSDQRNAWEVSTTKERLAFQGRSVIALGDATWRELVVVNRTEWLLAGENGTYKVFGRHVGEDRKLLFASEGAQASPTINGSRIGIRPSEDFYEIVVERDNATVGVERVPAHNESVEIGDITFERDERKLFAVHERTRIQIAEYLPHGRKERHRR
jgi:membrane associated rhomboid family serine protease